jgi:hypothetical protein
MVQVEERNRFALNVLKRVRVKLEGREPDSLRKVQISGAKWPKFRLRKDINKSDWRNILCAVAWFKHQYVRKAIIACCTLFNKKPKFW